MSIRTAKIKKTDDTKCQWECGGTKNLIEQECQMV